MQWEPRSRRARRRDRGRWGSWHVQQAGCGTIIARSRWPWEVSMKHDLVWQWCEGPGLEHCTVTASADGIDFAGSVVADWEGRTLAAQYALHCDAAWRFVRGKVRVSFEGDERQVAIERLLSSGEWRVDGRDVPELAGCEDIDLMGSPVTNTLPVRRLHLVAGEAQVFDVAW